MPCGTLQYNDNLNDAHSNILVNFSYVNLTKF